MFALCVISYMKQQRRHEKVLKYKVSQLQYQLIKVTQYIIFMKHLSRRNTVLPKL